MSLGGPQNVALDEAIVAAAEAVQRKNNSSSSYCYYYYFYLSRAWLWLSPLEMKPLTPAFDHQLRRTERKHCLANVGSIN